MLSIENPLQDPPSSCSSGLKSLSNENKASDKLENTLDLLALDLVDNGHPLPNFSIRDYVFCTRGKDMTTNWPFSQKSLQLCLKHGLKELLPPFQSAPSSSKGKIDLIDNKNASNSSKKGSSLMSDQDQLLYCSSEKPRVSFADKELNSATKSCKIIESVPTKNNSCLEVEASGLGEPLIDKSEVVIRRAMKKKKRERINRSSMKKCRMIMKLSNIPHPSSGKEDTDENAPMVSEAVAVCPVCRVFSSSSNTTLNAHIDQCLSGEPTTKGLGIPKVIKHRIKPRKMRLMVDIYKTAERYTLEDLDRRNGTSWATSNLGLPAVDQSEMLVDHNKQQLNFEEENLSEGPVYIDANGTKLRILSKSSDLNNASKDFNGPQSRTHASGDSGSKLLLAKKTKKKNNQIPKQHKISKHDPPGKKESSEINKRNDKKIVLEETNTKEKCMMKQHKDPSQVKISKPETIRGWVCSKRSGLTKKINGTVDHPGEFVDRNSGYKRDSSSPDNSDVNQKILSKSPNGYPSKRRIDMPQRDESGIDQPSLRKRMKFSIVESPVCHKRTRSLALEVLAEHGVNQLIKDGTSCKDYVPSLSKRRVAIKVGPYNNANHHPFINGKLSTHHHSLLSKSRKLSSLRKRLEPATAASVPYSKFCLNKKSSATKKPWGFHMSESNKELAGSQSLEHTRTEKSWCQESMDASDVRRFNGSRGKMYQNKEEVVMKSSRARPLTYLSEDGDNDDSSMLNGDLSNASETSLSAEENIDASRREAGIDMSSEDEVEDLLLVGSRKSLNPGFIDLASQIDVHCHSGRSTENSKGPFCEADASILSSEHDIFCSTVTPESMMMTKVCMMVEEDSSEGQGNYMDEVDPIPIPGPPGSFLPSPGRMDSDDLHGNSSLTSARFQCSVECQELVDHPSESPAATSTNSISTLARSGLKISEKSSTVGLPIKDTLVACSDFAVESCLPVPEANLTKAAMLGVCGSRSDNTSPLSEAGSCRFGNDQQCCCARREGLLQNVALNYQDSQLLKRRTMGTMLFSAGEIQMSSDLNKRLDDVKSFTGERSPMLVHNDTIPTGKISLGVSVDTQVKFRDNGDYDLADPPATPVLRLMGKNLMVINENENNASPPLKPFSHANLQAVSGHTNVSSPNTVHHKVRCLESREAFSCNQTETCIVNPQEYDLRWSNGVGNYRNMAIPQTACMNPTMFSTQSINQEDLSGCLIYPNHPSGYCSSPNAKVQPGTQKHGTPLTYNKVKLAHQPLNVRCNSGDISSNTIREVIIMDGTRDSEDDSTVISSNDCSNIRGAQSSSGIPVSMSLSSDTQNYTPYYLTQRFKDARYSGFLFDANSSTPSPSGINAHPF